MPRSRTRVRKDTGEVLQPSNKADRIRDLLKVQLQTFPQKELFPEEIANWERDLEPFPIAAIEWAFENWRKNGRFFPVYADILDQCIAWEPPTGTATCSSQCRKRHGQGYNGNDMLWLYEQYNRKRAEVNGPLKDEEIEALMAALDKHRGKVPAWRAA